MSIPFSTRRLASSSRNYAVSTSSAPLSFLVPSFHRRTFFWGRENHRTTPTRSDPLTEEYLKKKPSLQQPTVTRGGLAPSSIFEDEEIAGAKPDAVGSEKRTVAPDAPRNPEMMSLVLDPDPSSRQRWERKMVIREIRKRGRLTRTQIIKRQEREIVSKSHDFKTSVKKLMLLARQIAGKSVEEAIVQMRFSKKKAASEVKAHLEHARNEAIVKRGMALGKASGNEYPVYMIKTKDGKRRKIEDPTSLYVDQAWVGKGLYEKAPDHRARGRIFMMKKPSTHISVLLKEEATRIRQHEEREEKFRNRKVWTQLPNRPITAQRQHVMW